MRKVIRIHYVEPARTFAERLEDAAQRLLARSPATWDPAPQSTIEREVALTLDRLNRLRIARASMEDRFRGVERVLQSDLELRISGRLRYVATFDECEALRDRLWRLEREQVRLAQWHLDRIDPLHDRLLTLLNRRSVLGGDENGR